LLFASTYPASLQRKKDTWLKTQYGEEKSSVKPENSQTSGPVVQEKNPMQVLPTNHECFLLWLHAFHPKYNTWCI